MIIYVSGRADNFKRFVQILKTICCNSSYEPFVRKKFFEINYHQKSTKKHHVTGQVEFVIIFVCRMNNYFCRSIILLILRTTRLIFRTFIGKQLITFHRRKNTAYVMIPNRFKSRLITRTGQAIIGSHRFYATSATRVRRTPMMLLGNHVTNVRLLRSRRATSVCRVAIFFVLSSAVKRIPTRSKKKTKK